MRILLRAALAIMTALALAGIGAPARAAGVQTTKAVVAKKALSDCQDGTQGEICFWNWYNFQNGGGWYKTHIQNAYGPNCVTLPAAMVDKTTSFYFYTFDQTNPNKIRFFLWANCNPGGGYFTLQATQFATHQPDLTCPTFMSPCSAFYNDNIVSFDWIDG